MSLNQHMFLSLLSILLFTQTCIKASATKDIVWEGSVYVEIDDVPPEKAWPCIEDFCNVYKIYPVTISFCEKGDPKYPKAGDRRVTGVLMNGTDEVQYEQHRLIKIDRVNRYVTYRMMANNLNVNYYQVTVSVAPSKKTENGSLLRWHYHVKPVKGYNPTIFNNALQYLVNPVPGNIHKWLRG